MLSIIKGNAVYSLIAGVMVMAVFLLSFSVFEPTVSRAITDDFIVTQTITSEISFVASTTDVTMSNPITSLTGGTSNGTTTAVVRTNDSDGYTMQIHFSSTTAMSRNGGAGVIANYAPATPGTPDYNFDTTEVFGQFAYRVTANAVADIDPTFEDNGADTCGPAGGSNTYGTCWFNPEPVGGIETIIDSDGATAASGATTTLNFRVYVPPNPNPTIPDGTYTATATLTVLTK